jgi:hypothetical protein
MSDHLSKRAQLLAEILRYINDGNYEKAGEAWSFGLGRGDSRAQANQDEATFQKMRRLVYDHVARTVAIQRISLSSPPTVDSLAGEFKKLMDELTPQPAELWARHLVRLQPGATPGSPKQLLKPRAS